MRMLVVSTPWLNKAPPGGERLYNLVESNRLFGWDEQVVWLLIKA